MDGQARLHRRYLLQCVAAVGGAALVGCGQEPDSDRYTPADVEQLAQQRLREAQASGTGRHGQQVYRGYRGLSRLPWFDLDPAGRLICSDPGLPRAIDVHAHLGMSVLFAPTVDLQVSTERVRHLLDCDADNPGCDLDLDIYINGNFSEAALKELQWSTLAQGLWGSAFSATQTIPNLLDEMDAMRVDKTCIMPIKMGLPFGDNLAEQWRGAIAQAGAGDRLINGLSVHPRDSQRIAQLRIQAATGARLLKLHPTVQSFYPDDPDMMEVYAEAERLGLVVFFHGGRAGIEPESRHRYALPRHYEAVLANFPELPVILGHAGARDGDAMLKMALQYDNAWLDIHGQGVSRLDEIIERTGGQRLLFGTDWPFYHVGASLAKVLICTEAPGRRAVRTALLRDNALALFPELSGVG